MNLVLKAGMAPVVEKRVSGLERWLHHRHLTCANTTTRRRRSTRTVGVAVSRDAASLDLAAKKAQ
jgi:hypothetical protein